MLCPCCVLENGCFLIPKHDRKLKLWLWSFGLSSDWLREKSPKFLVLGTVSYITLCVGGGRGGIGLDGALQIEGRHLQRCYRIFIES